MPTFQVLVHAKNLVLTKAEDTSQTELGGLYVWRAVDAPSEELALGIAVSRLLEEPEFQSEVWNTPEQPPEFEADEVRLVTCDGPSDQSLDGGFVFYAETDD
jgi:hypothetical protein